MREGGGLNRGFTVQYLAFSCLESVRPVTIEMKFVEQYSPVVLFIMLYKVVPTF